jgi:Leucine-rich repeat (LRR) protein
MIALYSLGEIVSLLELQTPGDVRPVNSSMSLDSTNSTRDERKRKEKDRAKERFHKLESLTSDFEMGRIVDVNDQDNTDYDGEIDEYDTHDIDVFSSEPTQIVSMTPGRFLAMQSHSTLDRSSSDQSTGSLLYCKTPNTGAGRPIHHSGGVSGVLGNSALGKSSSLIFPTGVDSAAAMDRGKVDAESSKLKMSKINLRLDQCDALRFPFKKKLLLDRLNLSSSDIPMKDLCGTTLGNSLYKLSLSGNRLGSIPPKLVMSLPSLRTLDLSQCELHQLPEQFNLPKLTLLNLSNNRFTEFPDEVCRRNYSVFVLSSYNEGTNEGNYTFPCTSEYVGRSSGTS